MYYFAVCRVKDNLFSTCPPAAQPGPLCGRGGLGAPLNAGRGDLDGRCFSLGAAWGIVAAANSTRGGLLGAVRAKASAEARRRRTL